MSPGPDRRRSPARARLAKPLERAVASGHPWVYRDALAGRFEARPGDEVVLSDRRGRFLARGVADAGPIAIRIWSLRDEPVDEALLEARIRGAADLRWRLLSHARPVQSPGRSPAGAPPETDAYRLLHGEGDRTPGIVCDRYGRRAVVRFDGAGVAERFEGALRRVLPAVFGDLGVDVWLRRSGRGRTKRVEAWSPADARDESPPGAVPVREHGMTLLVDLAGGQKTGLFLDQRASRRRVRALAAGASVLNLYGYTGGFSVAAALGGARRVDTVDVARDALALAEATFEANGVGEVDHRTHPRDVPELLREAAARGERWDLVIADPPSFAPRASARRAALAAYRELHRACVERVADGGLYLAASCSSHVDRAAFEETLERGARAAGRALAILDRWEAPPDHPRRLGFPEGNYLTVALSRVEGR